MSTSKSAFGVTALVLALMPAAAGPVYAQGAQEFIVQFREGTPAGVRRAAAADAGASVRIVFNGVAAATVRVPNDQALAALQRHRDITSIVPNRLMSVHQSAKGKPGGGGGGGGQSTQVIPAGVARVGAAVASLSDGAGIGVAILDTGVDLKHQDLAGTVNAFTAFGSSCQDNAGHGTHVAGIVGARDNNVDVVGVAPKATLYCVKVLDQSGSGSDATVMAGLDWVLSAHASAERPSRARRPGLVGPFLENILQGIDNLACVGALEFDEFTRHFSWGDINLIDDLG